MRTLSLVVLIPLIGLANRVGASPTENQPAGEGATIAARQVQDLAAAIAAADRERGPLGQATARLAAGDFGAAVAICGKALADEEGRDRASFRLVAAEALLALDRTDEAAAVIRPALGTLGVLEPWGALLHGEALAQSGDPAQALAALDRARATDPDGPLGRRAAPARILALARKGSPGLAKAAAKELATTMPPRVRLVLADALAAAKDPAAVGAYQELWREQPGTPEADRARARLEELVEKGFVVPAPTIADRLYRAEKLLDRGRHELAAKELENLPTAGVSAGQRARATLLSARAAVAKGDRALAEKLLAPILDGQATDVLPDALELGARLAMRRGDTDAAVARLDRIARERPDHRLAAEAEFLGAFFLYDAGRFGEAEARFIAFTAARPGAARADEAAWYAAWTKYLGGRTADAAAAFGRLLETFPKSTLAPRVRYWRGRALERAGDREAARAAYRELAREAGGWYPLLASTRLAQKGPAAKTTPAVAERVTPAPVPGEIPLATAVARGRLARAVALYAAGLPDAAGEELDAAVRGEKRAAVLDAVARVASQNGDAFRSHRLGGRLPPTRGGALAFPRAFAADVERAAGGLGVDPHFVWAIMRRESAFRPAVRSHAAAVGLMQLLPKTALAICETTGLETTLAGRLGEPAVNVALGTWYLARLLERFDGHHALAAAAYNAGPEAVTRWLDERAGLELDEFVESIPYRETRHYVKHVIGDLATYRRQAGAPAPALATKLPKAGPGVAF